MLKGPRWTLSFAGKSWSGKHIFNRPCTSRWDKIICEGLSVVIATRCENHTRCDSCCDQMLCAVDKHSSLLRMQWLYEWLRSLTDDIALYTYLHTPSKFSARQVHKVVICNHKPYQIQVALSNFPCVTLRVGIRVFLWVIRSLYLVKPELRNTAIENSES